MPIDQLNYAKKYNVKNIIQVPEIIQSFAFNRNFPPSCAG